MSVVNLKKGNFDKEVLQSDKPVLIDFWAAWCGPCRMIAPVLDELAKEVKDVKIAKVNVDEEQELAFKYQVQSIPTLLFVKDGKVVSRAVGVQPKDRLLKMIGK